MAKQLRKTFNVCEFYVSPSACGVFLCEIMMEVNVQMVAKIKDYRHCITLALLALIALSGCGGSRLGTVSVKGKITLDGQPVVKGMVFFQPVDAAKGRPARAGIKPDGSYVAASLDNDHGIVPGEYNISVMPPPFEADAMRIPGRAVAQTGIPPKYRKFKTSGLTLSVPGSSGPITYNIEMSQE